MKLMQSDAELRLRSLFTNSSRGIELPPHSKLVMPSRHLYENHTFTPSWLMVWKRTLIPMLQGEHSWQGKYRLKVPEGTVSYFNAEDEEK